MQQHLVGFPRRVKLRALEIAAIERILAHGTGLYFFNTIISASIAVIVLEYGCT